MKINKLFLVLCISLLAFASCKKEDTKPQDNNNKVALAMRSSSGDIVSLVDCEKLTEEMKSYKGLEDTFIVESVDILDKTAEDPYCFRINMIDVQNERTVSIGYVGDFVEEVNDIFYAVEDFENGNYKVTEQNGNAYRFVNHELAEPGESRTCGFWIKCEGEGCRNGTCQTHYFRCTECESVNAENPGVCSKAGLGWGSTLIVTFGAQIVAAIIRAIK